MLYRLSYMSKNPGTHLNPVYNQSEPLTSLYNKTRRTKLERVMGIEPTYSAWKAEVLPLNYTRKIATYE